MPNTDNAQGPLRELYSKLDQMRDLLKIVDGNFKVTAGTISVSMLPADVQGLKIQYVQLISQIQQTLRSFPDASAFFP